MNEIAALFYQIGEPYAAGLFEEPEKGYFYRHSLGLARYLEALSPAKYEGESLYPAKNKFYNPDCAVSPHFLTYTIDWQRLNEKSPEGEKYLREFYEVSHKPLGGTHSTPNFRRIVREGLASYRARILAQPDSEFCQGLLVLLDGMENYVNRSIAYLQSVGAPEKLISAMQRVPFYPAQTFYEGVEAWNIIFYFDGADNLGCLDEGLAHLYDGQDYTELIGELFGNLDAMGTWSCTVGYQYNEITYQAVRAVRGRRRPMLELMVSDDMPDELWQLAIENIRGGCCNPSFYHKKGIYNMLKDRFPHIPDEELALFCGCGCTETNLQGLTRSGGTDENLPILLHLENYMKENLCSAPSFEAFYEGFCRKLETEISALLDRIAERYEYMAKYFPNPARTLFTDDCIEKGLDFNAGGARYTWAQASESGLINAIDSLLAIREIVFQKKLYTPQEFLEKLEAEDPMLFERFKKCPCFGRDDDEADTLGVDLATCIYKVYRNRPAQGFIDAFLLTEHQYLRYEKEGLLVGPTPDGRRRGEPTCDSIAALRGKAVDGPTAMLLSAAKLPQHLVDGISVINLTLGKNFVGAPLRALVEGYFARGGIQVQVTCVSVEELQDALVHPENHGDLIVRVGGYTEYFTRLTPALQKAVVQRNIHELGA